MNRFIIKHLRSLLPLGCFCPFNFHILALVLLLLSCVDLPTDPRNPSNCKIELSLKSSIGLVGEQSINDSVGKNVEIRVAMFYPEFIKSTRLQIFSAKNNADLDTNLVTLSKGQSDTIKIVKMFSVAGEKKVVVSSLVENGVTKTDTAFLTIFDRIIVNHMPEVSIDGNRLITSGEICSLKVVVNDTDIDQSHTVIVRKSGQSVFVDNKLYLWIPAHDFVGKDTLIFIATDNGSPALSDTEKVVVEVVKKKPDAPQHLRISSHAAGLISLAWEQTARAIDYVLYRSDKATTGFTVLKDSLTGLQFTDQINSSEWYYYVLARNKSGVSVPSNIVSSKDTVNIAPQWDFSDTLRVALNAGTTYTLNLQDTCFDANNDILQFTVLSGTPATDTINNNIYSFISSKNDTGNTLVKIVAKDPGNLTDTLVIKITHISITLSDKVGPVIALQSPAAGSSVSSSSVTVGVKCTDDNGIASVNCSVGGKAFEVIKSISDIYTANIIGLIKGSNDIVFIATDGSANSNKTTDTFKIVYDPTMTDNVAPIITLKNPISSGDRLFKDSITVQIACVDDNGIATVSCKRTGLAVAVTNSTDSLYSAKITGLVAGKADTITFIATDKSTKANSCTLAVVVQYTTFTITYIGNGSTNGSAPVDVNTYEKGATATVKANTGSLIKTGATFTGWNTLENGTGTTYTGGDEVLIGAANVILYAKWTTNPVFTVTYNGNGNTGGTVPVDTKSYEQGATVTVKGNTGTLVKTDSTFSGWNTLANGTGTTYTGGVDFTIGDTNVTLFAKWIPNTFTITFDGQGATTAPIPVTKSITSPVKTLGTLPTAPQKTSYTFAGWWTQVNGGGTEFTANKAITANDTVYAKWEIRDLDGNVYTEVTIGTQVWMVENLRTTKFNDNTDIPKVTDSTAWAALTTPGYCYYNNTTNTDSIKKFGALYNWYAADTKKLAPTGWHVPSDSDWRTLTNYLIANGYNYDGTTTGDKIAKSLAAKSDWAVDTTVGAIGNDLSKNNSSGFSGLPGGLRFYGGFKWIGVNGFYLCTRVDEEVSSCAYSFNLWNNSNCSWYNYILTAKVCGQSIRVLKD